MIPKFKTVVDEYLEFKCVTYGWLLPDDHELYKFFKLSVRKAEINITSSQLVSYELLEDIELSLVMKFLS